jgi:hypothetical protein
VSVSVVEAVERDLAALGSGAKDSTLAATALALARELDDANSATSKSMCAKAMVEVLRELRSLAPPKRKKDKVDDIAAQRERRRARSATAAAAPPS